jgi:hypothetical protein
VGPDQTHPSCVLRIFVAVVHPTVFPHLLVRRCLGDRRIALRCASSRRSYYLTVLFRIATQAFPPHVCALAADSRLVPHLWSGVYGTVEHGRYAEVGHRRIIKYVAVRACEF